MEMYVLVVVLATAVGLTLGLLGGGGSILTVPLLAYVAGMEPSEAIAASLVVVGATSLVSTFTHARTGNVLWRTGVIFGAAAMAGAFVGGLVGGHLPGTVLMVAFAVMMVATALAMIRGRTSVDPDRVHRDLPLVRMILDGLVIGLVTGLVGAGGGFLIVPALTLLAGLPMPVAVGTSLLVITMKSATGLAGYLTTVSLAWPLVIAVTLAAIVGALVGARLTARVPETALRQGFGIFVLVMGAFVLSQELPVPTLLIAAVTAAVIVGLTIRLRHQRKKANTSCEPLTQKPSVGS